MKVKEITFPTPLSEIKHIDDDNIDVFVDLEDGYSCTIVLITPKNLVTLMDRNKKCFFDIGHPMIIVKELSMDCIKSAIEAFSEGEAYWLKEYHLSGSFGIDLLNKMLDDKLRDSY